MIRVGLRVLSLLIAAAVLTAAGGFSYLYFRKPSMAPPSDVRIAITPARLARGKYRYNLADCDGCHSQRDFSRFDPIRWQAQQGCKGSFYRLDIWMPARSASMAMAAA